MSMPVEQISKVCKWAKKDGLIADNDTATIFFSIDVFEQTLHAIRKSFGSAQQSLAIKSNPIPAILRIAVKNGFALEAASLEEVRLAFSKSVQAEYVIFDSPVKTRLEISEVAQIPNLLLNANSIQELSRIPEGAQCKVGLRINPLLETDAQGAFAVSKSDSKFGVPISKREAIIQAFLDFPVLSAFHMHIGSGIGDYSQHIKAVKLIVELANEINSKRRKIGLPLIDTLDIGGGLKSMNSVSETCELAQTYAQELQTQIPNLFKEFKIVTEFGHLPLHHSSWLISHVEYVSKQSNGQMAYVHVGADLFMRKIYGNLGDTHQYFALSLDFSSLNKPLKETKLVGPLCFAGDVLEDNVMLPELAEGDNIAITQVGANTVGLWSAHCSRDIPKIILYSLDEKLILIAQERKKVC